MRKLKLLFTGLAFFGGVFSANAQTDVTSTYITDADFSSIDGWTQDHSSQYWSLGNGFIGSYAVANNKTSSTDETHLATESCLGIQCRWSGSYAAFTQTTSSLPIGAYTLTFDVQNKNSSNNVTYENRFKVTVGDNTYTDTKTEWMNGSSDWTTHTISFNITEAGTATISLGYGMGNNNLGSGATPHLYVSHLKLTWTDPLQAAKAALQAEIDKAKLCDEKEGLADAIAAAESVLASATTEDELAEALATLQAADKDAVLRYENGLADATYSNPIVTDFVVNGTFDSNTNGWTATGGFPNQGTATNQSGAFTVPFWENWTPASNVAVNKMYQTINDIPNGTYRLDIAAFVNNLADPNESQYVFANDDKTYLTTGEPTAYEVYTVVTNNQVEIGLEQTTATANWMGIDNVSLRYYGAGDVINDAKNASHKLAWLEAKAAAEAAIANEAYENVTGSERTALEAEIDKAEPTTAEGYDEAAAALTSATQTFVNAKTNYDIFAAYNKTLDYADPAKKPSIDEETTAASIIPALRAYYESHALAEGVEGAVDMTSRIINATDPTNNDGWTWTGSKNNPASNEPWTDADGTNTHSYFDGGNWNGSNWTTTMKQTISLPAGKFLLTAKGRAATNTTLTMAVGEASVELPHVGNSGNVFDRGWGDGSVEFTTDGSDVEIVVTATAEPTHEWFSISDFRLMRLELYTEMAGDADYAALNDAITAAEAKTLGFDKDEYAPYNNVDGLVALANAKALNQSEENAKADVEDLTKALSEATWTPNEAEVNAFYDGDFAIQPEHTTGPTALNGWSNPEGIRQLIKNTTDYPGLTYARGKAAVFAWGNTSMTYGDTEGYTMPLNAHTIYELSFKTCGWKDGDMGYVSVSVKNANSEGLGDTHSVTATKRINEAESDPWDEFKILFVTGEAGNYTFGMWTSKHTTFTDLKLVKAASQILTIADTDTKANWAPGTYANVTLDRTLSSEYWNTFSVPFNAAIPEGWTVKEYDSENSHDNVIAFKNAESLVAGKPYLVKPTADDVDHKFYNVVVESTEGETMGEGEYKFAAQIYNKPLAYDGTIAYLSTDGTIKKLTSGGIKGLRAYFIIPAGGSDARISFGGEETGIQFVDAQNASNNAIYDVQGRKVNNMKKGVYVVNGKKVIK